MTPNPSLVPPTSIATSKLIWIVEDDESSRFVYREALKLRYELEYFPDLGSFRSALEGRADRPALVIADICLADESFLRFLAAEDNRARFGNIPFIVVSSVTELDAMRFCLANGAADYMTKPFQCNELLMRIERALAGRPGAAVGAASPTALLELDPVRLTVRRKGAASEPLTAKEFQLVALLREACDCKVSRDDVERQVWPAVKVTQKALDVHFVHLRRKLAPLGLDIRPTPLRDAFQLVEL